MTFPSREPCPACRAACRVADFPYEGDTGFSEAKQAYIDSEHLPDCPNQEPSNQEPSRVCRSCGGTGCGACDGTGRRPAERKERGG